MSEAALILSILALGALAVVGYLTYSLGVTLNKVATQLEKLTDHVDAIDKNLEKQHAALMALDKRVNAKSQDPIHALLGLIPNLSSTKWAPVFAVAARGFAAYLGKKAQQRSALKPKNVNSKEGTSSDAPQLGGKV